MKSKRTVSTDICADCGEVIIHKSKTEGTVYNIVDDGKLVCDACAKKRREAVMAKTFDYPMREGR